MTQMVVERPGMLSTVQDLGRTGHQKLGVAVNGPMDEWSHRVANALVGNDDDAAVLECTVIGPRVRFTGDVIVALCGASMNATVEAAGVEARPLPTDRAVYLRRGTVLDIGHRTQGARAYLAVRGGFDVPLVLGSRSTNLRSAFGGLHGRALVKADHVAVRLLAYDTPRPRIDHYAVHSRLPWVAGAGVVPTYPASPADAAAPIRFIPGPHWSAFTPAAQATFQSESYAVSAQSDRMGMRLGGPPLTLVKPLELVSEATVFGTVQVPPDGQPIVLMADRSSAGGYPKIGYVATADLPRLAQCMPGDTLRFEAITQHTSEALWLSVERCLAEVEIAARNALYGGALTV